MSKSRKGASGLAIGGTPRGYAGSLVRDESVVDG